MKTVRIVVTGVVQGVGFRPFVYKQARALGITGSVINTVRNVEILAQGSEASVQALLAALKQSPPPQSQIESIETETVAGASIFSEFIIGESQADGERVVRISRDLAVCSDCLAELLDPGDRRHFYPYINCTNCGPRFTIVRDIPYDRVNTTMAAFPMCPACEREYLDPGNRRFHAQPNACPACGPAVTLVRKGGEVLVRGASSSAMQDLISQTAGLLAVGAIVGIKGLGGFHIACRADDAKVVSLLRLRKRREEKPFALMVSDPTMARAITVMSREEEQRLLAVDAPILLLDKKPGNRVAEETAPRSQTFGIMLPYTPLQRLLFTAVSFPLVMTSANFSDEPIISDNERAIEHLEPLCDYFLLGDRDIFIRTDDSVLRLFRKRDYPVRRSRGFAPAPIVTRERFSRPVLAVGAELKNTVCLAAGEACYLSQHIGDLKNRDTYVIFLETVSHFMRLLRTTPALVAHDLHPQYLSTQFALDPPPGFDWLFQALKMPVQHHHAHIASCLADNDFSGPVIGIALDGTGYGEDDTVWGGEILLADRVRCERRAFLEQVRMPGGDLAVQEPWRMALAYLVAAFGDEWREALPESMKSIQEQKLLVTVSQLQSSTRLPVTSSCGRLFDAMAALSGVCQQARYEGQPAIEFEQALRKSRPGDGPPYAFSIEDESGRLVMRWRQAVRQAAGDATRNKPAYVIADRFHRGLVKVMAEAVMIISRQTGIRDVALSGGCFMNMTLLEGLVKALEKDGLHPLVHSRVPCNDGGIALGQAVIAAARTG